MRLSFSVLSGHSWSIGICRQQARWRVNDFSKTSGVGSAIRVYRFYHGGLGSGGPVSGRRGRKGFGGARPLYILF